MAQLSTTRNMKIQFDHQIFTNQQYGGISRYFHELIKRFDGLENISNVSTLFSNNAYYNEEVNSKVKPFFPKSSFRGKGRIMYSLNQQVSKSAIGKGDYDVLHPTYYDTYFLKTIKSKPFVVTFYDMIHEKFENQFSDLKQDKTIYNNKKLLLEHSSRIIAISESTKRDIIEIFNVDEAKIEVVYLGNSLKNPVDDSARIIEYDYILFVGNRGGYKNFELFMTSIADLLKGHAIRLVCAGGGLFTIDEMRMIKKLDLEPFIEFKKIINDSALANFYRNALFFSFPSLYEGFGIPVLESFACNCPALLSNGGSLPEIGGDAAAYFDPTDSQSIYTSVSNLINTKSLRQTLKENGVIRLKEFSWDKTFADTLDVYKSIL
jgi:glycosyltransferase involved in cell wall biosynthesis